MRKLLTKLQACWSLLWGYAHGLPVLAMHLHKMQKLRDAHAANLLALGLALEQRDQYERELRLMQMEPNRAEAQLMQLRVHGMSRNGVVGYGVTAFIPEDVLTQLRAMSEERVVEFSAAVAENLVYRAVKGLWYRTPLNNVAVMVFDPKQPHLLHAVCMTDANGAPAIKAKSTEGIKQIPEPRPMERPVLHSPLSPWK